MIVSRRHAKHLFPPYQKKKKNLLPATNFCSLTSSIALGGNCVQNMGNNDENCSLRLKCEFQKRLCDGVALVKNM